VIKVTKNLALFFILTSSNLAFSNYYKTLPKGVRNLDLRNYRTTTISSNYNHSEAETPFNYEIGLDSNTLKEIDNEIIDTIFEVLEPYPEAANALDLGKYRISAQADMNIDVIGMGYGITNRITAYVGVPIYKASVQMKYQRPQGNNYDKVAEILQNNTNDDFAQGIGSNIEEYGNNLDIDGSFLQNLVVNHFNYNEVGDWEGEGPGDTEFGVMWNFLKTQNYGLLLTVGGSAPTGRVDDPNTLQDIGFGDGSWDAFVEFGGGATVNNWMILNSFFRYTYQLSTQKDLRVPYSQDVFIGDELGAFEEKLGDKFLFHISSDFVLNDWFGLGLAYEYNHTEEARYKAVDSKNSYAESILASNTESVQHNVRFSGEFSTITPFTKGNFLLPARIRLSYQQMIEGRNTAKYDQYMVEYRMFF
jgi:hypothetical protein